MKSPIALFCFNRPDHLEKTIISLKKNDLVAESELFIFSDGPREGNSNDAEKVSEVREQISKVSGFKRVQVFESPVNKGLASSVIEGVSLILRSHKSVIVLEDDILVTRDFLKFMNESFEAYKSRKDILSVSGYSLGLEDVQGAEELNMVKRASSWGWGTWKDKWFGVDWELKSYNSFISDKNEIYKFLDGGRDLMPMLMKQRKGLIDSWAVRWSYHHYLLDGYCVVPKYSKVRNIGTDGSGTNFNFIRTTRYDTNLHEEHILKFDVDLKPNKFVTNYIRNRFSPSLLRRVINYFKFGIWV
ncbi:sugar transferase [Jiulongibacter sp. NS-SX5]|uniref:sugar transferase n=1 Tax=Jiulongibacter sp. NS-SX5 TaxID=3463854 RepID=UPI00405860C1